MVEKVNKTILRVKGEKGKKCTAEQLAQILTVKSYIDDWYFIITENFEDVGAIRTLYSLAKYIGGDDLVDRIKDKAEDDDVRGLSTFDHFPISEDNEYDTYEFFILTSEESIRPWVEYWTELVRFVLEELDLGGCQIIIESTETEVEFEDSEDDDEGDVNDEM